MTEQLPLIARFIHKIMRYLPYITIAACLLVYAAFIIQERYSSIFNLSLYLIPLIVISIILIINKNNKYSCDDSVSIFNISFNKLKILYFIALMLTIISLGFGNQGWSYIILAFVMYCIILAQLFSKGLNPNWFILEIMITTSILILPQLLGPAYYYGDTDLIFHESYASTIINAGSISTGYGGVYELFCGYHLLISSLSMLTGMAANVSLYIVSTIAVIFSIPIVYAMGIYFTKSQRISSFSVFFYALLPIILNSLLTPAPRVMASMALFIIIYLLLSLMPKYKFQSIILVIIVTCYMVLTHHAQLLFIVAVSTCLVIGILIYSNKQNIKKILGAIVLISIPGIILCINYWDSLLYIINSRLFGQLETGAITDIIIDTKFGDANILSQLLDINYQYTLTTLSSTIMIIFIFAGICILYYNINKIKKICYILPLVTITFIFFIPGIIDLIPSFDQAFQLYRLRIILAFFFSIIIGVGCVALLNIPKKKITKIIITIIVIVMIIILIISSAFINNSYGNDIFENNKLITSHEWYFENGDLSIIYLLNEITQSNSVLYSDFRFSRYFSINYNYNIYSRISSDIYILFTESADTEKMKYIIYPYKRYDEYIITVTNGVSKYLEPIYVDLRFDMDNSKLFEKNIFNHNLIYGNNLDLLYYLK